MPLQGTRTVYPDKAEAVRPRITPQTAKPDVTSQRKHGVSAAARPDISPISTKRPLEQPQQADEKAHRIVTPGTPISRPRTLRRTAEPIKSQNMMRKNRGDRDDAGKQYKP